MKRRILFLVTALVALLLLTACDGDSFLACEHESFGKWETEVAATCLSKGKAVRKCTACEKTETKELPALGHEYGDWKLYKAPTCTANGTERRTCVHKGCKVFESRTVLKTGHDMGEWTLTEPATCVTPGTEVRTCQNGCSLKESRKTALAAHTYANWVVDTPSTCSVAGMAHATCTIIGCGDVKEEALPLLSHAMSDYSIDVDSTCSEVGSMHRECRRPDCTAGEFGGVYTETAEIPKKPHTYGDFTVTVPPSCFAEGEQTRICALCSYEDKKPVEKTAHTFGVWQNTTPATCIATGEDTRLCTVDGCDGKETRVVPTTEHTFSADFTVATPATCEAVGEERAACTVLGCTAYDRREIPALGHSFITYTPNGDATCLEDGTESAVCESCDKTDTRVLLGSRLPHAFSWVVDTPATCVSAGVQHEACTNEGCTAMQSANTPLPKLPHAMTETPALSATCTAAGNLRYFACAVCEKMYDTAEGTNEITDATVLPLGHLLGSWMTVVPATCSAFGKEIRTCTRMGCTEGIEYRTVNPKSHSFITYIPNNNATCTADGTKTAVCEYCSETDVKLDENTKLPHDLEWVIDTPATETVPGVKHKACKSCDHTESHNTPIPAGNHSHSLVPVPATPATCLADGVLAHFHCDGCGQDYSTAEGLDGDLMTSVVDPKKPHAFGAYASDNNATCTADGTKTATCGNEGCTATDTVIDLGTKKPHEFEWVTDTPATCESTGIQHEACKNTGCNERRSENTPLPKLAHVMRFTEAKAPTCIAEGNVAYYTCSLCEKNYTNELGESVIWSVVLLATGIHTYETYTPNGDATCLQDGTKTATCKHCPETDTLPDVGSKKPHAMTETPAQAVTCTENGSLQYFTCSLCELKYDTVTGDNVLSDTVILAPGHDFGAELVKTPATCEAAGEKGHTCRRTACGLYEKTADLPALGHEWNDGETTKTVSCLVSGEITYTCKRDMCGKTRVEMVPAPGHSFTVYHYNNDAVCGKDGTETAVCDNCSETDIRTKAGSALSHSWSWVEDVPATETAFGVKHEECANCSDRRNENTPIDKLVHVHTLSFVAAKTANCQEAGNIAHYICSGCDKTFSDAQGTSEVSDVTLPQTPNNHNYSHSFTVDRAATTTTPGVKSRHCLNEGCTSKTEVTVIPKLDSGKPPEWTEPVS